jgi:hypothetical protein
MPIFTDLSGQGRALITAWLEVRVPPGPTILILCSCLFNDLAPNLSSADTMLDKRCSPSALDQLRHAFARHVLAVGGFNVALHFGKRRMSGN